jgi:precorrin-6x reductase
MGTRTYSRRSASGTRVLTAAGRVKFNQVTGLAEGSDVLSQENVPVFSNEDNQINYAEISKAISNMTPEEQEAVLKSQSDNVLAVRAIGMYGGVEQRLAAMQILKQRVLELEKNIQSKEEIDLLSEKIQNLMQIA